MAHKIPAGVAHANAPNETSPVPASSGTSPKTPEEGCQRVPTKALRPNALSVGHAEAAKKVTISALIAPTMQPRAATLHQKRRSW